MKTNYEKVLAMAVGTSFVFTAGLASAGSGTGTIQDLEELVIRQQQQLDSQASEIAALKEQLSILLGTAEKNKEALAAKVDKEEFNKMKTDKMVNSKNANVDVELYGQVNRAALWADNGDSSKTYFVDNDISSTRMGINAKAAATGTLDIGGRLEYELISNSSSKVSQEKQDSGSEIKLRWADVYLKSKSLGKVSLGHGSTYSDSTAEVDLSGTSVTASSKLYAMAGGQLFYDEKTKELTDTSVKNVFYNIDGLSRKDRVSYETPAFAGFSIGGSAVEEGAFDAGLKYSRKFEGVKVAGAFAWADPQDLDTAVDYQLDGSLSLLLDMGLSFTFAAGQEKMNENNRDDGKFWYGKVGYKADLFSPGTSAFSIDYGQFDDFVQNDDEGKSYGLAFVQSVKDWGTEFYLSYRLYQLDRVEHDLDDIHAAWAGMRLKF